jgi:hypothetical protein
MDNPEKNICNLCNYVTYKKCNFIRHCTSNKIHSIKAEINKICYICNKKFNTDNIFRKHMLNVHKNKNKNNDNKTIKTIKEAKSEIINKQEEIREEIINKQEEIKEEIKEVKHVVNKAISKASSLIKYLMEHHPNMPPLKKINHEDCLYRLKIDFNCPTNVKDKYNLQRKLIDEYKYGTFIENLSQSIINLIKNKDEKWQSVFNTDSSRQNYVIKINDDDWNEDIAGKRFGNYIIKPLLKSIGNLLSIYREKYIEKDNGKKMGFEVYLDYIKTSLMFESDIVNGKLLKPILKEVSPFLRLITDELESLEKFSEIEKFQKDLLNIVKPYGDDNNSDDDNDYDDNNYDDNNSDDDDDDDDDNSDDN